MQNKDSPPKHGSVLRNTLILVGAHFLGMPLTILVNAMMGRYLGASDFGYLYLATTLVSFGFLFVDWGHSGVLPAAIAQDRSKAGVLLGSSLAWRMGSAVVVGSGLATIAWFFGYPASLQPLLALVGLHALIGAVATGYADAARGFERTDVAALLRIGSPLLAAVTVIPTLILGGGLLSVMIAQVVAGASILPLVISRTSRVGIDNPRFDRAELKRLTTRGWAFLVFTIAMTLQGTVDAISLSKFAPPDVVGWHAAAQRLTGVLLVPASALIASLYPTLARLLVEDKQQYHQTLRRSIHGTALLAIPLALCCALYRELGVSLYSQESFGPAEQNLLVLSAMVLLLYFSMPLGSALLAAGRQAAWAWAQSGCVVLRLILNPLLIPWFQDSYGNGGLGVCVSAVVSEVLLVVVAIWFIPGKVMDRALVVALGKAVLAGCAMVASAWSLRYVTPWLSAPVSLCVYAMALWLVGGIDRSLVDRLLQGVRSRLQRST